LHYDTFFLVKVNCQFEERGMSGFDDYPSPASQTNNVTMAQLPTGVATIRTRQNQRGTAAGAAGRELSTDNKKSEA
jgi:hypothetical protein